MGTIRSLFKSMRRIWVISNRLKIAHIGRINLKSDMEEGVLRGDI